MSDGRPAPTARQMLASGIVLAAFAAAGALGLAATHAVTAPRIADNVAQRLERELLAVLPDAGFDAPVSSRSRAIDDPAAMAALGIRQPGRLYEARRDGEVVAVVFDLTTPEGYSGDIRLLIGVRADGRLSGVRAVSHRETPGLGDKIEAARSDWILGFAGRSLGDPPADDWKVRRDGGAFDQFSGATITPRAVVAQVRRSLEYAAEQRGRLFSGPAGGAGKTSPPPAPGRQQEQG